MTAVIDGSNAATTGLINAGTAVATTSGTIVTFTGIPAGVKRITVMLNGVSTNSTGVVQIQVGSGSVNTSGYSVITTTFGSAPSIAQTSYTSGFALLNTSAATYLYTGILVLDNITGNTWVGSGTFNRGDTVGTMMTNGSISLSGSLDRVAITTTTGTDTFDAGSVNIFWE